MRTKRQHTRFHIFGLYFLLLPLFLYHWQQPIIPRNTLVFGYEINAKIKSNSLFVCSCVDHMTELVLLVGPCSAQWSNTWVSESGGLGFFLTVPDHCSYGQASVLSSTKWG